MRGYTHCMVLFSNPELSTFIWEPNILPLWDSFSHLPKLPLDPFEWTKQSLICSWPINSSFFVLWVLGQSTEFCLKGVPLTSTVKRLIWRARTQHPVSSNPCAFHFARHFMQTLVCRCQTRESSDRQIKDGNGGELVAGFDRTFDRCPSSPKTGPDTDNYGLGSLTQVRSMGPLTDDP